MTKSWDETLSAATTVVISFSTSCAERFSSNPPGAPGAEITSDCRTRAEAKGHVAVTVCGCYLREGRDTSATQPILLIECPRLSKHSIGTAVVSGIIRQCTVIEN